LEFPLETEWKSKKLSLVLLWLLLLSELVTAGLVELLMKEDKRNKIERIMLRSSWFT